MQYLDGHLAAITLQGSWCIWGCVLKGSGVKMLKYQLFAEMLTCSQEEQGAAGIDMCLALFPQCTEPWLVCSWQPAEEMSQLDRAELWQPEWSQGSGLACLYGCQMCAAQVRAVWAQRWHSVCIYSHGSRTHQGSSAAWAALAPLCCLLLWKCCWFGRGESRTLASKVCLRRLSYIGLLPHPDRITKRGIFFCLAHFIPFLLGIWVMCHPLWCQVLALFLAACPRKGEKGTWAAPLRLPTFQSEGAAQKYAASGNHSLKHSDANNNVT